MKLRIIYITKGTDVSKQKGVRFLDSFLWYEVDLR